MSDLGDQLEAYAATVQGNTQLLDRPLLLQVGPKDLISNTKMVYSKGRPNVDAARLKAFGETPAQNLLRAYQGGVMLITAGFGVYAAVAGILG